MLRRGLKVRTVDERAARGRRAATLAGTIEVRLQIPSLLPGLRIGAVAARAQVPSQELTA